MSAEFDSAAAVLSAAEKVRDAGYKRWDVFSPFPIHGLDKVMGLGNSKVGWFSFLFGGGAFIGTMLMIWYMNDFDYPINIGGKPMFSPPMSVVPSYILLVLMAGLGTFIGMVALNELPRHHHPLFAKKRFELVSRDKFFLVIGSNDPKFSETETRKLLEDLGGGHIEIVEDK
ncbi:MAG TPA: DUF3341 domain-containing protein [Candidatus Sulfotelmatobacter sp.]|nr:DUF3341 domain-containing protein [Candidatus Sulfotelmatobacter sp.]